MSFFFRFAAGMVRSRSNKQIADVGDAALPAAQARPAVRSFKSAHRLARKQKILQHSFFHQEQRPAATPSRSTS